MTVNGMGVAAKFILREPPLDVSKKDMPGQPSPAPGVFGCGNGAAPAHGFGSGYVPDWGYDSGYDSGYGTVHGSGDGSDFGFGSGYWWFQQPGYDCDAACLPEAAARPYLVATVYSLGVYP